MKNISEMESWVKDCYSILGEQETEALIEYGFLLALEQNEGTSAGVVAKGVENLLKPPLKLKPDPIKKHTSLFELEAKKRSCINLVVNNH